VEDKNFETRSALILTKLQAKVEWPLFPDTVYRPTPDMAMGWVNPWIRSGWVGASHSHVLNFL